jgi:hypothetical protein
MNRKIWIGLLMIVVSYGQLLIPAKWALDNHFAAGFPYSFAVAFFAFGVVVLSEGIVQKFGGVSLLGLARGSRWKFIRFFLVAAVVGLILEVFAQWLGKLWYYAYYPNWFYWPALVPSFMLYWVMIVESYMAVKAVLDHVIRKGGREKGPARYYRFEPYFYGFLGTVGTALFMFGTFRAIFDYIIRGGYTFNVQGPSAIAPALHYIIIAFIGLWLVCEGALYVQQLPSLIRSMLHGYFVPVLALLCSSLLLSLVWESQNAQVGYWVYTNWPGTATVLGVQLSVILTWPANYIVYLLPAAALVPAWAHVFWTRPDRRKPEKVK